MRSQIALGGILLLILPLASLAQSPDLFLSTATTAATEPVSVFTAPDGSGQPLSNCYVLGGALTNATITLTLLDNMGSPVVNYSYEDLWLETSLGGLQLCTNGSVADANTDVNGQTTFSGAISGGGQSDYSSGELTQVFVDGFPLTSSPGLEIYFNSGDLNGDLRVDLCDIVFFVSQFYAGSNPYSMDFYWDATFNLSDIALMAQVIALQCPGSPAPSASPPNFTSRMGIYFDTAATSNCIQSVPVGVHGPGFMYLIATDIEDLGGLAGFECGIEFTGSAAVIDWGYPGNSINFSTGNEDFAVGLSVPLPWQQTIILMDMTIVVFDPQPVTFTLRPNLLPTTGPYPAYAPPGEICNTTPIWESCRGGPAAVINGPCPPTGMDLSASLLEFELGQCDTESQILTLIETATINTSVDSLVWEIPDPGCSWLTITPTSGEINQQGGTADITFQASAVGLAPGYHECNLTIISNACHLPYAPVTVQLTVSSESPTPAISSITDVGNDQGRWVRLIWEKICYDEPGGDYDITGYEVYRRQDAYKSSEASTNDIGNNPPADQQRILGWDYIATVPAHGDQVYQYVAPTLCDSTITDGLCWSVFFLRATTPDQYTYFDSDPDSGYSVDNLAPLTPRSLHVNFAADQNTLTWEENTEEDLWHYQIYRGYLGECGLDIPTGEPVATVTGTGWSDNLAGLPGSAWDYCYWLKASDYAGNESDPTQWSQTGTTGLDEADVPVQFALHANYPNPFNPMTTIRFDLPRPAPVILSVYDVTGRLIRALLDEESVAAGKHEAIWNGRDEAGRLVATGIYFCRLQTDTFDQTQRMMLIK